MNSVGGYDLEREIGAGSTGTVWKAFRQGPIPHPVALKRLRAASGAVDIQRMRREAALLAELDHPHIVRVVEILEDGEGVAVAMQFAPGGSLEGLLQERGRLTPGEVVAVAAPLAGALASAHRHGTVHGDVKPANVLFTSDGEPLLSDFGSARTLGFLTSENFASTPEYMAPELLEGATPDERTDVYSLAVVCYHALVGSAPFTGDAPLAVVRAADVGSYEPLVARAGVPPALAQVVERGMARNPAQRFESAEAFAHALRGAVPPEEVRLPGVPAMSVWGTDDSESGSTVTFGPRPPRPDPQPEAKRRGRRQLSGIVILVGLFAIGGTLLYRWVAGPGDGCFNVERPPAGPDAQVVVGDPIGDGCEAYGIYEPAPADWSAEMVFRIHLDGQESAPIGLGQPGDEVVLGDWNCDGADTLGHYLRSDGEVHYYDTWPAEVNQRLDPVRKEQELPVNGTATLAPSSGDGAGEGESGGSAQCDRVEISEEGANEDAGPAVGDCVSVVAQGALEGVKPCDPPDAGPYRVTEVVQMQTECPGEDNTWLPSGESRLCLAANLHVGSCYVFPPTDDEGNFEDGWVTTATCQEEGTVEIVDIVQDPNTAEGCSSDDRWDRTYWFSDPIMVTCVREY